MDWGGSSEGCLKYVGGVGVINKNTLKQGVSKGKSVCRGFEGVTAPAPIPGKF